MVPSHKPLSYRIKINYRNTEEKKKRTFLTAIFKEVLNLPGGSFYPDHLDNFPL